MKRRLFCLLLACLMMFAISGCSSSDFGGNSKIEPSVDDSAADPADDGDADALTESDDVKNETVDDNMQNYSDEFADVQTAFFTAIPKQYVFSSTASAWTTELNLNDEGSFTGRYRDYDMDDFGEGYPFGTVYTSEFNGKFAEPEKINNYTYSTKLELLELNDEPGGEYYENGTKYIYSDAYGLNDADEFLIYLPGIRLDDLPEDCLSLISIALDDDAELLPFCCIYNVNMGYAFIEVQG